jgi:hypothetical protein
MIELDLSGEVLKSTLTFVSADRTVVHAVNLRVLDDEQGEISRDERVTYSYPERGSRRVTLHLGVGQDLLANEVPSGNDIYSSNRRLKTLTDPIRLPSDRINDSR